MKRQSSLVTNPSAVSRNIDDSAYDNVVAVVNHIDEVTSVATALVDGSLDNVAELTSDPLKTAVINVHNHIDNVISVDTDKDIIGIVADDLVQDANSNIVKVGSSIGNVNTVGDNISSVGYFADIYQGAKAFNPTTRNDLTALLAGDLYFNTVDDVMKVYTGAAWVSASSSVSGINRSQEYTATDGQTIFTVTEGYDAGYLVVYREGFRLGDTEYTATDGSTFILDVPAVAGDTIVAEAFGTFTLADHYTKTESDATYEPIDPTILRDSDIGTSVLSPTGDGSNLNGVVKTSGNEVVAGIKTFSSSPIIPTPTTSSQAATKQYVDDNTGGGKVLQVVNTVLTSRVAIASATDVAIAGLSVAITPKSLTSKMLITVDIGRTSNSIATGSSAFTVYRDSTKILIGDLDGIRQQVSFGAGGDASTTHSGSAGISGSDEPNTLSQIIYSVSANSQAGGTVYINGNASNQNDAAAYAARTVSSITVMEIGE